MQVPEILRVAAVALVELVSSGEFLLVALVELELERVFLAPSMADGGETSWKRTRRGRGSRRAQRLWRARRSSTTSFLAPSMADGGKDGGEDDPKTKFWKSKLRVDLKCFRCIRGFLKKRK
jgi:hypothetical protein